MRLLHFIIALVFVLTGSFCFSQSSVEVSDPRLVVTDNKLGIAGYGCIAGAVAMNRVDSSGR